MKLEKAVEKARMQQQDNIAPVSTEAARDGDASGTARHLGEGWQPPVYEESRHIRLDAVHVGKNRCIGLLPAAAELESYKMLRTQLIQRTKPLGWNTIMITSACPGEGKTLTAINLALTFAKSYSQTVLLVDCDLRRQSIYHYLGLSHTKGLSDHLLDGVPLKELIIWPEVEQLTLISGGRTIADSAELLASPRMRSLMTEMKGRYADRYILLDSPPLLSGADALTLAELADGIVMVVESGKTDVKLLQEALALVPKEKVVGFLLNKHSSSNANYYNYYYQAADRRGAATSA